MDKTTIQSAFTTADLSRLTKDIDRLAKPSIRLYPTPVDEDTLSIGASKLGGVPDFPADIVWPQWKDVPQSFIAQMRLEDIQAYDIDNVLPHRGMLWFFYDAQQETYGADPADRGGWQVLFKEGDLTNLQKTPFPAKLPAASKFNACSPGFASEITFSQQPPLEISDLDWTDEDQKKYESVLSSFASQTGRITPRHRMLGFSDTIQDDMRLQCQLASNGVTDINDPKAAALSKGATDWQLLLQVDTDQVIGMRWGDAGMLYYWIKSADLQTRHFDASWLVLQSE